MAVYITTRCPHCKNIIENRKKENVANYYGSPFKKCPYCQKTYLDEKMKEPALFSQTGIFFKSLRSILTVILFSWVFSIILSGIINYVLGLPLDIEIFDPIMLKQMIPLTFIISLIWLRVTKPWDWNYYIEPSMERLMDEKYFEEYKKVKGNYIPRDSAYAKYMRYREKDSNYK